MSEWISVKQEPPKKDTEYLVWCREEWFEIGSWRPDEGGIFDWFDTDGYPTHYMPLPATPVSLGLTQK